MFLPPAFSFCVDFFNIYFPSLCLQVRSPFLCNVDPIRGIFHSDVVVRIPELHSGSLSHPVSLLPTPRPSRKLRRGLVRRVCDISAGPGEGSAERGLLRPRSDPSSFLPLLRPGKSSGLGPSARLGETTASVSTLHTVAVGSAGASWDSPHPFASLQPRCLMLPVVQGPKTVVSCNRPWFVC